MKRLPVIQDHMDTEVPTLKPGMDIFEAIGFLLDNQVTGAPVLDEDGGLLGILTARDCLGAMARGDGAEPVSGSVADHMTTKVITAHPRMNIYFAAGLFLGHSFRRLPIVENGRLVGAITRIDLLRAIRQYYTT